MYEAGSMGIYLQGSPAVVCESGYLSKKNTVNLKETLAALTVSLEDYWKIRAAGSNTKTLIYVCKKKVSHKACQKVLSRLLTEKKQ